MFARPPATALPAAETPAAAPVRAILDQLRNPVVGAGAAGAIALAAVAAMLVWGDPHAGAPHVRVRLADPGRLPAPQLRAAPDAGAATPDLPATDTGTDLGPQSGSVGGQAVITLPQGARVSGPAGAPGVGPAPIAAPVRAASPLPAAPIAGLQGSGPGGPTPVIARDGRTAFGVYSRPFTPNGKPRIALMMGGLGLNGATTRAAIEKLPAEVTLSFVAYADGLQSWVDQARAHGHEVVIEVPMEPNDFPNNDPGPYTLMAQGAPAETARRLNWVLSRAVGYFALTNYLGGRFLASGGAVDGFMAQVKAHGLGFIDDGSAKGRGGGAPRASADSVIDQDLSAESIDRQLSALEAAATTRGQAFGAGFAYPVTVETVARWADRVEGRGYQLAPASAITRR